MKNYKIKVCQRCGNKFEPMSSTQKYCKECRVVASKEKQKQYNQTSIGKEIKKKADRKYRQTLKGKEVSRKINRKYKQTLKGKETNRKSDRKHYQTNREKEIERVKRYCQTPKGKEVKKRSDRNYLQSYKGKEANKRHTANRRNLGYKPVNEPFVGCRGHHYDNERVIHIPEELHKSVNHCLETGVGMEKINRLAIDYLWIEMWNKIGKPEFLEGGQ